MPSDRLREKERRSTKGGQARPAPADASANAKKIRDPLAAARNKAIDSAIPRSAIA